MLRFRVDNFAPLFLVIPLLFLVACTKQEIEDHSMQFNEAVGSLENQLLLLNAVRASKDYPTRFSKLHSYTGTSRWDGTYAPDVPFPIQTARQYKLLPSFKFNPGVNNLQLADLNTAEAQSELKRAISFNAWYYYLRSGWDDAVVNNIAIERMVIHERIFRHIAMNTDTACDAPNPDNWLAARCKRIDAFIQACSAGSSRRGAFTQFARVFHGHRLIYFWNRPSHFCPHMAFQAGLAMLDVNGFLIKTYPPRLPAKPKSDSISRKSKVDSVDVSVNVNVGKKPSSESGPSEVFGFADPGLTVLVEAMLKRRDLDDAEINPLEISLRSPESMVRFLGEVIAAELYAAKPRVVTVLSGPDEAPLFFVERGTLGFASAAVSIRDAEDEQFSIPIPEHGSSARHRSLQTLAFVQEVMGAAISMKALPPVTNVLFSPTR